MVFDGRVCRFQPLWFNLSQIGRQSRGVSVAWNIFSFSNSSILRFSHLYCNAMYMPEYCLKLFGLNHISALYCYWQNNQKMRIKVHVFGVSSGFQNCLISTYCFTYDYWSAVQWEARHLVKAYSILSSILNSI